MKNNEKRLREVLKKIAQLADSATNGDAHPGNEYNDTQGPDDEPENESFRAGCTIKPLPARLQAKAAQIATQINPVNAPALGALPGAAGDLLSDPQSLTLLTSKYWGPSPRRLTVSFMNSLPAALRSRIISHMNAWTRTACISFVETSGTGQIRISTGPGGYWSYLGTDVLLIPNNRPTMNLQGFSMNTPEREFVRVVRHETGHTLGFPHEHMRRELIARIDRERAYEYFWRTQGWNRAMVDAQVLTPLDVRTITGTAADQTSIMCYHLPGSITRDGRPILGGPDINATDYAFAGRIYPRRGFGQAQDGEVIRGHQAAEDWSESDDVRDEQIESANQASLSNHHGPADRDSEYEGTSAENHA